MRPGSSRRCSPSCSGTWSGGCGEPAGAALAALRERDALLDRPVAWAGGEGTGAGIDESGALLVRGAGGAVTVLDAGEVHLA